MDYKTETGEANETNNSIQYISSIKQAPVHNECMINIINLCKPLKHMHELFYHLQASQFKAWSMFPVFPNWVCFVGISDFISELRTGKKKLETTDSSPHSLDALKH